MGGDLSFKKAFHLLFFPQKSGAGFDEKSNKKIIPQTCGKN